MDVLGVLLAILGSGVFARVEAFSTRGFDPDASAITGGLGRGSAIDGGLGRDVDGRGWTDVTSEVLEGLSTELEVEPKASANFLSKICVLRAMFSSLVFNFLRSWRTLQRRVSACVRVKLETISLEVLVVRCFNLCTFRFQQLFHLIIPLFHFCHL